MKHKFIISGGGTGGHIFPAIAIANGLKQRLDDPEILFVGAEGRMEMEKVPQAGYRIIGLPIMGLQRRLTLKNLKVPFMLLKSQQMAKKIIREFQPDAAIGVGGYASGPTLNKATGMGVPGLIQEQNSYPGITNKILAKKVQRICVAYDNMERFFDPSKIVKTGNPIRAELLETCSDRDAGIAHFELDPQKRTVLVVGGSLGARTVNQAVLNYVKHHHDQSFQFIWQTGKYYYESLLEEIKPLNDHTVHIMPFISEMGRAYAAADVVISRAGALSISELSAVGKASVFVPSPNVSEDHQTKNAMALVERDAALMIKDQEVTEKLPEVLGSLLSNSGKVQQLEDNIKAMGILDATDRIVDEVVKLIKA